MHFEIGFPTNVLQGIGETFCRVPMNCQRKYGDCDSDVSPAGYNTSMDSRSHGGEVPYGQFITGCTVPKTIALTYDDGPSENTEELLDILQIAGAKATFFISGNTNGKGEIDMTVQWTRAIKRMDDAGHQIASHGWSHPDFDNTTSQARKDDMVKNERALANIVNKYPTYMRPPYSRCSPQTGCLDDMGALGYHVIKFSVDSSDYAHPEDLTAMINTFEQGWQATDPDNGNLLLVQHDTIHESAIELTKHILDQVSQRGWKGECLLGLRLPLYID